MNVWQPCPTHGPVKGFVRPNLGFLCSKISYVLTFLMVNLTFMMKMVFRVTLFVSVTVLQLEFRHFQYIS